MQSMVKHALYTHTNTHNANKEHPHKHAHPHVHAHNHMHAHTHIHTCIHVCACTHTLIHTRRTKYIKILISGSAHWQSNRINKPNQWHWLWIHLENACDLVKQKATGLASLSAPNTDHLYHSISIPRVWYQYHGSSLSKSHRFM